MKDDNRDQDNIARREFLQSSAAGAVGAMVGLSALRAGLGETLAEAQRTGKPLLTEEALNGLFATGAGNERSRTSIMGEAKGDVKGFIRGRFTLTPFQEQRLESLSGEQLETIKGLLASAEKPGGRLTVKFQPPISNEGQTASMRAPCKEFSITLTFKF